MPKTNLVDFLPPGACKEGRAWLSDYTDPHLALNEAEIRDLHWLACKIDKSFFNEVIGPSLGVYHESVDSAKRNYHAAIDKADSAYDHALNPAWGTYEENFPLANKIYEELMIPARKIYDGIVAEAWKLHEERIIKPIRETIENSDFWANVLEKTGFVTNSVDVTP